MTDTHGGGGLTISSLEVVGFKRIRSARVDAMGARVSLGGDNSSGKSSLIQGVEWLFRGAKSLPPDPLNKGASKAEVWAVLSRDGSEVMHLRRTLTAKGSASYKITNPDGSPLTDELGRPITNLQQFTDRLIGSGLLYDCMALLRMKPKEQADELRRLFGIDTADLDAKRTAKYQHRRDVGRDRDAADGHVKRLGPLTAEADAAASDVGALTVQYTKAQGHASDIWRAQDAIGVMDREIADLEVKLVQATARRAELRKDLGALESMPVPDLETIAARLQNAQKSASDAAANAARREAAGTLARLAVQYDGLTAEIEAIDAEKQSRLTAAQIPVEGLEITDEGVTLNGLPFTPEQMGYGESLAVCVAAGFCGAGDVPVLLIRDGGQLDTKNMRLVAELAEQFGGQVVIERPYVDDQTDFILEDGEISAVPNVMQPTQSAGRPFVTAPAQSTVPNAPAVPLDDSLPFGDED